MPPAPPRSVAGITTVYRKWSHADVILGKLLEGYLHDGGEKPSIRLASLYVDQFPEGDLSKDLAAKHGFRLCKTIPEALTLGGDRLAVDGVLLIGGSGWSNGSCRMNERRVGCRIRRSMREPRGDGGGGDSGGASALG